MRLLVLGSGGKVGRLLRVAWPADCDVVPTWHGGEDGQLQFDILEELNALKSAISETDAVLLLAGVTHARSDRMLSINAEVAESVLTNSGSKRVFLTSSAAVYGSQIGPLQESIEPTPLSAYGVAKQEMEQVAARFANAVVLRLGNVAGADALLGVEREKYVLDQFPSGGFPVRSYIGPQLLAEAIVDLCARRNMPSVINVACPDPVSMDALLDAAGKPWEPTPAPIDAIERVHLDTHALWAAELPPSDAGSIVADLAEVKGRL